MAVASRATSYPLCCVDNAADTTAATRALLEPPLVPEGGSLHDSTSRANRGFAAADVRSSQRASSESKVFWSRRPSGRGRAVLRGTEGVECEGCHSVVHLVHGLAIWRLKHAARPHHYVQPWSFQPLAKANAMHSLADVFAIVLHPGRQNRGTASGLELG